MICIIGGAVFDLGSIVWLEVANKWVANLIVIIEIMRTNARSHYTRKQNKNHLITEQLRT